MSNLKNYYEVDSDYFVRVSTVLSQLDKPYLKQWASNCAIDYILSKSDYDKENNNIIVKYDDVIKAKSAFTEISNDALQIGSHVHELIKCYVKGRIENKIIDPTKNLYLDEKIENSFLAFLEFEKNFNVKWLHSELFVYSKINKFAGQLDAICKIEDKIYIVDFKTSSSIYDGMDLQLSAYIIAYNELYQQNINNIGIVRIDKMTGQLEWKDMSNKIKQESFLHLLNFYYTYKKRRVQ